MCASHYNSLKAEVVQFCANVAFPRLCNSGVYYFCASDALRDENDNVQLQLSDFSLILFPRLLWLCT